MAKVVIFLRMRTPILIVYMRIFEATNIFAALTFMKKVKAMYRLRMEGLTDGAQYYRTACKFLSLDHDVLRLKAQELDGEDSIVCQEQD